MSSIYSACSYTLYFQSNQMVNKRKGFFTEKFQLMNTERRKELDNYHFALLNEIIGWDNNHQRALIILCRSLILCPSLHCPVTQESDLDELLHTSSQLGSANGQHLLGMESGRREIWVSFFSLQARLHFWQWMFFPLATAVFRWPIFYPSALTW